MKRIDGEVICAIKSKNDFIVSLALGETYRASKLIFATGIVDIFPDIHGFDECWGKSVLHCPYCHGYEVKGEPTGILGNGDYAFEFGCLISNWTDDLTIYTNGLSTLTADQTQKLQSHNIKIVQDRIALLQHTGGYVEKVFFRNGATANVKALYAKPAFRQHSLIPGSPGCEIGNDGYIQIDSGHRTTVPGVYACGDNVSRMRTVSNAIAMGTATAITVNKDLILESFQ